MGDAGGDFVDQIRRNNEEELLRRVIEETKSGLRRLGGPAGPLPVAPNELGPPGSSAGLHGSAGMGGYDLAQSSKKRKRRRAALGIA
jgi:hypothetical protein